ncbi:hypothetical protein HQ36_08535 [Porphyromonas gingivicanis]|uniref:Uncharacterized protein n=1 Tax=Porphyromonas gingivicanis TaxID=266762 RepID=A0A0A2G1D3_9PORP|nr:hypothetical protein HQ36_08535 [Porphyromonas gingivicanis]
MIYLQGKDTLFLSPYLLSSRANVKNPPRKVFLLLFHIVTTICCAKKEEKDFSLGILYFIFSPFSFDNIASYYFLFSYTKGIYAP